MRYFFLLWTFPNTLLGLLIGSVGLLTGGKCQAKKGCLEFHGGFVKKFLQLMPTGSGALAMTIGHTILGQTKAALDITRDHEHVHVRQFERWGPFFIPAYFLASGIAWMKGGDSYRDNVFEIEAYDTTDLAKPTHQQDRESE